MIGQHLLAQIGRETFPATRDAGNAFQALDVAREHPVVVTHDALNRRAQLMRREGGFVQRNRDPGVTKPHRVLQLVEVDGDGNDGDAVEGGFVGAGGAGVRDIERRVRVVEEGALGREGQEED